MRHYQWAAIPVEQLNPLVSRQVIHSDRMTIARLWLKQGVVVPLHSHESEQISTIETGSLKFIVDGVEQVVGAGETLEIPSHLPHSAEALEDTVAVDVFSPRREDWLRGDDAYLRGK
jgi:quercetin dioxygenase-like cupin family protein